MQEDKEDDQGYDGEARGRSPVLRHVEVTRAALAVHMSQDTFMKAKDMIEDVCAKFLTGPVLRPV